MAGDDRERALEAAEQKLTAAARLAGLGYWEIDVAGDRVSWSEESARILGLPATERSRSWDDFLKVVYPDDRPILEECRARLRDGEPPDRVAFR
jgi:PAS domain-containing protein